MEERVYTNEVSEVIQRLDEFDIDDPYLDDVELEIFQKSDLGSEEQDLNNKLLKSRDCIVYSRDKDKKHKKKFREKIKLA